MSQQRKRRPGRPAQSAAGPKRVALSMRTTQNVRDWLEEARINSGRSLVQEVEYRLERSFLEDERYQALVGEDGGELARLFGAAIRTSGILRDSSSQKPKPWFRDDPYEYAVVENAIRNILEILRPGEPPESERDFIESAGRKIAEMHVNARSEMVAKKIKAKSQRGKNRS